MYRICGIADRIEFCVIEADNAFNNYKESKEKMQEKIFKTLDFRLQTTQSRINNFINCTTTGFHDELAILFRIIEKELDGEREKRVAGIATHLMAILLNNFATSHQLWMKIVLIVNNGKEESLNALNFFLRRQCVMNRLASIIEEYFKSLCQIGDDFFIDLHAVKDPKKLKLFKNLQLPQMIVLIHHLINNPPTTYFFKQKIFESFQLTPTFVQHLKVSLRNLSL